MQEDSRLNKLIHVQMQCEPNVSDLAIQTEFVAPPVRIVAAVTLICAHWNCTIYGLSRFGARIAWLYVRVQGCLLCSSLLHDR
jgi:hypothetical protein